MSCMLLADEIAVKLFFPEERALQVSQVKQYLQSNFDVDVAERAYQQVLNWAAKNPVRFEDPKADNSPNKGEVWGKIDEDKLIVNRDVLLAFLDQNGFDYTAVSKKWSEKGTWCVIPRGNLSIVQKCMGSSPVILSLGCRRMMT